MNKLLQRIVQQKSLILQAQAYLSKTTRTETMDASTSATLKESTNRSTEPRLSTPGTRSSQSHKLRGDAKRSKKAPMKTAKDVINRLKWEKSLDSSKFTVAYEDRFDGIIEKKFGDFDWDSNLASVGPDVLAIPQHRIQYFKYKNRIVWKKETRLDDFFGSTGGGKTIHDVMKDEDLLPISHVIDDVNNNTPGQGQENPEDFLSVLPSLDVSDVMEVSPSPVKLKKWTRPNCFIGVRVLDTDVSYSASQFVKHLENTYRHQEDREEFLQSVCSPAKHHVTLCICTLENEEEIERVKQVLQRMFVDQEKLLLDLLGVGQFNNAVVYAKVNSRSLYNLQRRLMAEMQKENINLTDNYDKYVPHMTLVKFSGRKRFLYPTIAHIIAGKKHRKWKFGLQSVEIGDIQLCKMRSTADDGFYEVLASSPLRYRPVDELEDGYSQPSTSRKELKQKMKKRKAEDQGSSRRGKRSSDHQRPKDVFISKSLTAVLRHNKFGFKIDSEGYVEVESILSHQRFKNSSKEDIKRIVRENDKKRFTIDVSDDGIERIKANQGHTVQVDNLSLTEVANPDEYPVVVHGTFWAAWNSIKKEGLHRRGRVHIHMTTAEPSHGRHVISGMRNSSTVFVYIDIAAARRDGIQFFVSSNGVILSSGDEDGYIKPKYFRKVIGISGGKRQFLTKLSRKETEIENRQEMEREVEKVVEDLLDETSKRTEVQCVVDTQQGPSEQPNILGEIRSEDTETMRNEVESVLNHLLNLCLQSNDDVNNSLYTDMPPLAGSVCE